ncbi:MAG TPA: DUF2007 domain-containing protein [Bryobacteraceae bacterium]|nr:DUF2007 domain-containing protein [Bryobacteraceae bacterium]
MDGQPQLVTVYRSLDASAREDCETFSDLLSTEGLSPVILDDNAPGVPEGAFEIRVPADQAERAERIIADNPLADEVEEVNPSSDLDLSEPVFHSEGSTTAEFEATEIQNILESNGIAAVMMGNSVLPNLPFEVRVAKENLARALEIIEEFRRTGPEAAESAEAESEQTPG